VRPAQATAKQIDPPFCEFLRVEGRSVTRGEIYYDAMMMLTQPGVVQTADGRLSPGAQRTSPPATTGAPALRDA
jgi:hypothetical protein